VGVPLTFRLQDGSGYGSITEAGLREYAGMTLQADGQGGFFERLGHAAPASYPYTLRYGEENAKRLSAPAAVEGTITTPWRVVLLGKDLDALVNSDAIHNLSAPPDPRLFPQGMKTPWLRPGLAVGGRAGLRASGRRGPMAALERRADQGAGRVLEAEARRNLALAAQP
jgi:alpha-glucosidase